MVRLAVLTIIGWLVHVLAVSIYLPRFDSAKEIAFRFVHALEISAVILGVMVAYHYFFNNSLSTTEKIFTVLGTLVIVDVIFFALSARARSEFDILHFVVAYLAITLVITFWSIAQR